jgi:hypothetical protein
MTVADELGLAVCMRFFNTQVRVIYSTNPVFCTEMATDMD